MHERHYLAELVLRLIVLCHRLLDGHMLQRDIAFKDMVDRVLAVNEGHTAFRVTHRHAQTWDLW